MGSPGFSLIGGHVALDFVNTVDWRDDPARRHELLNTFDDLLAWIAFMKLAGPGEVRTIRQAARADTIGAARILRRARRLRELLARVLASSGSASPRDMRLLNAFLAAATRNRRLEARGTGYVWTWPRQERRQLEAWLWPVVFAAAELLSAADRARIRVCAGHGCGWLFLDTSRNGRRRWCDMQACGNRAKARRFYERARRATR